MQNLLSRFISESLLIEKSRYERETGKKFSDDLYDQLFALSSNGKHPVSYAFTMLKIPKIGLNPKTSYETPAGVYFYPLSTIYLQHLVGNNLPFVSDNPYFGVVKLKHVDEPDKWLKFIDSGITSLPSDAVDKAIAACSDKTILARAKKSGKHWKFNDDAKIFDLSFFESKKLSGNSTSVWNKWLRQLGYIGIYDEGHGIIHPSEPTQLVCLSPEAYETVGIWETAELRKVNYDSIEDYLKNLSNSDAIAYIDSNRATPKTLTFFVNSANRTVRQTVATNRKCPAEALEQLANDENEYVRTCVAQHLNCPVDVLIKLSKDVAYSRAIQIAALKNPNFPVEFLIKAALGDDSIASSAATKNPKLPKEILEKMSDSSDYNARMSVALVSKDEQILEKLSKDLVSQVRGNIVLNPNCPLSLLKILRKDSNSAWVSSQARRVFFDRTHAK